ncbi:MAG: PD-(D/E)XK nuclease family protein, partial [Burkholderiales bacterium]|nr:PD-(D/E)XK nuclease family protein [Burkholderiales bacterium]
GGGGGGGGDLGDLGGFVGGSGSGGGLGRGDEDHVPDAGLEAVAIPAAPSATPEAFGAGFERTQALSAGVAARDHGAPWHAFPRGAQAGNFLHDELEWLAGEGFDLESAHAQQRLLRRCERQGWGARGPDLRAWLERVATTPLPGPGVALCKLSRPLPEMEFWFPNAGLEAAQVDALCRRHLLPGQERPALAERHLRGMLMGFADLVFEHGGRYWVLDYKSNHLGRGDADYGAEALQAAMAAHRYDVQAALYLLALHRLLRSRLGAGYEPARQLGGAVYLFLRGIGAAGRGCCVVPPSIALLDELDAALGAAGA